MTHYFGTDGIRGVANKDLTPEIAFKIGAYLGTKSDRVIIGKDTRKSSSMLESAIASGLSAYGADAYKIGYTSTPCLAYTVANGDFDYGIMISASHNPYYDNGIKIFAKDGLKIDSAIEEKIEDYIDGKAALKRAQSEKIGEIYDYREANGVYASWLYEHLYSDLKGLRVLFDLANGGAVYTFDRYKRYLDASTYDVMNDGPDGININEDCGSTHLEALVQRVKEGGYDVGFAFDGDADRVLACDSNGDIVDGDKLMYLLSLDLKEEGKLKDDVLVTTVMSNIGLYKALEAKGIRSVITAVGDRSVALEMESHDYRLGGEQSGHIIIKEDGMFGDGLKSALRILRIMVKTGKSLKELVKEVTIYPQLLVNKKTKHKKEIMEDKEVLAYIKSLEAKLNGSGRLLVRPSGTEPLIRVMAEAKSDEECETIVYAFIDHLRDKGYIEEE